MHTKADVVLGVDLGGTTTTITGVQQDGSVIYTAHGSTGANSLETLQHGLNRALYQLGQEGQTVRSVGIGLCGPVDPSTGICPVSCIRPELNGLDLREWVRERYSLPALIVNDTNAAGYGEWWMGAGEKAKHLLVLSLGTGIGGAFLTDGQVLEGYRGFGAEFGHIVVAPDGPECPCGGRGCLSAFAGARGMISRARQRMNAGEQTRLHTIMADGWIDPKDIVTLAGEGDPVARQVWQDAARYLGIGLATLASAFSPERIVLTGGITRAGDILFDSLLKEFSQRLSFARARSTTIHPAVLDEPGSIGAAGMAWNSLAVSLKKGA